MEKETQVPMMMDKKKTKIRKNKEKSPVEEIQVDRAVIQKFQNHLPFPNALLHPQRQPLTVNVGQRHATIEACACPVPQCLVIKLSLLA